jgi:hypothetical protein
VLAGVEITGWDEGDDVIDIKRLSDSATHKVGAGGEMMVALSADRSAEVTIKLHQSSSSNAYIKRLLDLQEAGAATFAPLPLLFQDTYRQDLAEASAVYIKKPSDMKRGKGLNSHEWTFVAERLNLEYGY